MEMPWGKDVSKANGVAGSGYIQVPLLTQGSGAETWKMRGATNCSQWGYVSCLKTKTNKQAATKKSGLGKRKSGWLQI